MFRQETTPRNMQCFYSVLEGITWHFLCMEETVTAKYFVCNAKCETMWLFVRYCLIFCKSPAMVIVYRKFCELLVKRIMWNLVLTKHWSGIHFINVCTFFAHGNKLQQHNYSCRYNTSYCYWNQGLHPDQCLDHWDRVTHIYITKLDYNWFR